MLLPPLQLISKNLKINTHTHIHIYIYFQKPEDLYVYIKTFGTYGTSVTNDIFINKKERERHLPGYCQ